MEGKQKAVFFDRDGVLNHLVKRDGSFYSPQIFEDFHIVEEAKETTKILKDLGYLVIVVSNQPDISRGKLEQVDLDKMTKDLINTLKIDDVFYCPHDDDNDTGCRKPAPGLFFTAKEKYNIDFSKSFMIGDTWKDVEAAQSANISMILLDKEYNKNLRDVIRINSLKDAVKIITNGN